MADERTIETAIGGAYEMPDGRSFWIDAPVAREMARRVLAALASTPQPASAFPHGEDCECQSCCSTFYEQPASAETVERKLNDIIGCFQAARAEGLTEQLAAYEVEPGNLVDLVLRRLAYAEYYAKDALAAIRQSAKGGE